MLSVNQSQANRRKQFKPTKSFFVLFIASPIHNSKTLSGFKVNQPLTVLHFRWWLKSIFFPFCCFCLSRVKPSTVWPFGWLWQNSFLVFKSMLIYSYWVGERLAQTAAINLVRMTCLNLIMCFHRQCLYQAKLLRLICPVKFLMMVTVEVKLLFRIY